MLRHLLRIPGYLAVGLIRFYQKAISPHLPPSCRYQPTCSAYAVEAIQKYGFFKGFVLATHRIARCHPWGGHGYDPPVWYSERKSLPSDTPAESES